MNMRLKKVLDDIQKTEDKILELQEYVKKLKIQKKQMEDAEIIKAIRSMKMDSREMLTFLDGIQNGTVTMQFDEEGNLSMDSSETDAKKEESLERNVATGQVEESEDLEDEELDEENITAFGSSIKRSEINIITISDRMYEVPDDAWDVSSNKDRSVMAYIRNRDDLTELVIAGRNGVRANTVSYTHLTLPTT